MLGNRLKFVKPEDKSLYPIRNKDGAIETLINPNTDSALVIDSDSHSNFVYNRYHHLPLESQRQKLPIFEYRNHILYLLEKYQTLVLCGETGCGKSTQVPQYLHEIGHKVCVTQPRVTAAVSLAYRVAQEIGGAIGQEVGYAAGMVSARTPESGIVFMTEGVLLREMFASPLLMQYSCIILDEVHERSLMTDVLMGLLKKIIKKRKNLKLVISSATMNAEFLKDFFNTNDKKDRNKPATTVVMSVQGPTHPIEIYYTQEPVPDYVKATVDTVIKIHENQPLGDILAFLTSQEEIHAALESLEQYSEQTQERNKSRSHFPSGIRAAELVAVPLYGALPARRQLRACLPAPAAARRVVLATNLAETSLTIPGITYVIDCGFHKLAYFDPALGVQAQHATAVSRDNATQRAGRSGRTASGHCYRLYTEDEYEKLPESVPPEMCRSDLAAVLLQLKALGIHNLLRFSFPTPPPAKSLLSGLETLYALGAIDHSGDLTSDVGFRMAELPVPPMAAKMLCSSGELGCVDEALSIAAMLQVDSVFIKPAHGREAVASKVSRRNHFEVAEGDIIMYLNIFDSYLRVRSSCEDKRKSERACKQWCQRYRLNHRVLEKAADIRDSLEKIVKGKFNIENKVFEGPDLGTAKCERVMKCVLSGYFPQAARLTPAGAYRGLRGADLALSPDSCLYAAPPPQWVTFASVQCSRDRTYMRDVMPIDRSWLLELAPHYYKET
ncbi:probable ATP-dependent RNA helicase DHX35 isoform X1 [Bombyx mori]|uniref:RNA helicase n=1 Tax=Bombyx mori TaxID=7091 RepID=A0A8R2R7P5_BOMMO|nr:probable ATP-dependent RNA helicase DHX35 [Bombyx mori]